MCHSWNWAAREKACEQQLSSAVAICQMTDNDGYWQLNQCPFYILNNITEPIYFHPHYGRKCHLPDEEMEAQRSLTLPESWSRMYTQTCSSPVSWKVIFQQTLCIDTKHSLALLLIFKSEIIKVWSSSSIFHLWPSLFLSWIQIMTN